jgi:exopolysaccharide biosynthesis polyprenyl glycosylphosphotransferase
MAPGALYFGVRMEFAALPRTLGSAEAVSGSAIVDINSQAIFRARKHSAFSENITRLMSTVQLGRSAVDSMAIVGPLERASREAQRIASLANRHCRIEIFSDCVVPDEEMGRRASKTDIGRLATLVRSGRIRRILLATPAKERQHLASVMKLLEGMAVDVDFVFEGFSTYSRFGLGMTEDVCIARILRRPLTSTQALIKSMMDRIGAFLLLVLVAPLLLSIALTVKLTSRGPILFRQKRFGLNNEVFEVFKFRTLYHGHTDPDAQQPVKRQDERVTPVGKFLRALSLDELPQLLNVLKGDMSLVGPRPLPVGLKCEDKFCSEYPHFPARHRVRPGITGLAQVNGWRGGMQVAEELGSRLAFDLAYIDNYSLMLDVKIVMATAFAMLRPRNAY